jgi:hypothetical protein
MIILLAMLIAHMYNVTFSKLLSVRISNRVQDTPSSILLYLEQNNLFSRS